MQILAHAIERRADVSSERIQRRVHVLKMGRFKRDGFHYSEMGKLLQLYRILPVLSLMLI